MTVVVAFSTGAWITQLTSRSVYRVVRSGNDIYYLRRFDSVSHFPASRVRESFRETTEADWEIPENAALQTWQKKREIDGCPDCKGLGDRPGGIGREYCTTCNGTGVRA